MGKALMTVTAQELGDALVGYLEARGVPLDIPPGASVEVAAVQHDATRDVFTIVFSGQHISTRGTRPGDEFPSLRRPT